MSNRIELAASNSSAILRLLQAHPMVDAAVPGDEPLQFSRNARVRSISVGETAVDVYGLIELMDNNPLVCANRASIPSPAATLALVALGPLIRAGILLEPPVILLGFSDFDEDDISDFLASEGWTRGALLSSEAQEFGSVLAATVIAAISTPDDLNDIDALYEEAFGRSFFIRRDENSSWDTSLVEGKPYGAYRLRINPDEPQSLLTIQVMADRDGKGGAAQAIHMMNVMSGFEESLGLD